jgi:hypothetical protein
MGKIPHSLYPINHVAPSNFKPKGEVSQRGLSGHKSGHGIIESTRAGKDVNAKATKGDCGFDGAY